MAEPVADPTRDREQVEHVEARLAAVDDLDGPAAATAAAAVEALVDLYGVVLQRVLGHITHTPPADQLAAVTRDELIGHVLMAHGLLPAPPEMTAAPPSPTEVPVSLGPRRSSSLNGA